MTDALEVLSPSNPAESTRKRAIVLLHGYGADAHDLAGLQGFLDPDHSCDWFFPNGIYPVDGIAGRCWFQLSVGRWLEQTQSQDFGPIYESIPEDFAPAHAAVLSFLTQLSVRYENIALGGFSQGAMLSTQLLPHLDPALFNRIVLFSGALINRSAWQDKIGVQQPGDRRILQSHGREDMVLPFKMGEDLRDALIPHHPNAHQFIPFSGGHEIPLPVLTATKDFLSLAT